jgi:3-oxoacyl-[acyl-carrier protein] reductase
MSEARALETIFITGAGRGIGAAVALDLARSSTAALVLVSRSERCAAVAKICNDLRSGCATAISCDLAEPSEDRDRLYAEVESARGPVGVVHAAGVLGPTGPFVQAPFDDWWKALEINLGATARLVHTSLPRMLRDRAGRIILFGGGGAAYGYPNFTSYALAKVALVRFAETLAMELGDRGPEITVIAPGANETDLLAEVRAAGGYVKTTVSIDEPCRLVRRLLLEDASGLSGRFIHVRDTWDGESARRLSSDHWKLRRVE